MPDAPPPSSRVAVVILAAGSSRRLGRPKQLLDLDGRPVLQHVVDAASSAGVGEIVVVLGHAAGEIVPALLLPPGARAIVNPEYASGQSTSLRAGLNALGRDVDRAVILLGDQPRIAPEAIRAVASAAAGPLVRASYGGEPGHPVAIDRSRWDAARAVTGDRGARELFAADPDAVCDVEIGGSRPHDLDTEADYQILRQVDAGTAPEASLER